MSRPGLVSVVMPLHDQGGFVAAAVESVLAQTYQDVEVLVVDDGSTDGGGDVVAELAGRDPRVRLWRRSSPSGGPAVPRNLALEHATGDYIAFLDTDDRWLPRKLEVQLAALEGAGAGLVYSDAYVDDGTPDGTGPPAATYWQRWPAPRPRPEGDVLAELALSNFVPVLTVVVARSVLDRVGGFHAERRAVDDYDMWLRVAAAGVRFACVDEPLAVYRWHAANLSSTAGVEARLAAVVASLDDLLADHPERRADIAPGRRRARRKLADVQLQAALHGSLTPAARLRSVGRSLCGPPRWSTVRSSLRRGLGVRR